MNQYTYITCSVAVHTLIHPPLSSHLHPYIHMYIHTVCTFIRARMYKCTLHTWSKDFHLRLFIDNKLSMNQLYVSTYTRMSYELCKVNPLEHLEMKISFPLRCRHFGNPTECDSRLKGMGQLRKITIPSFINSKNVLLRKVVLHSSIYTQVHTYQCVCLACIHSHIPHKH